MNFIGLGICKQQAIFGNIQPINSSVKCSQSFSCGLCQNALVKFCKFGAIGKFN